MPTSRVFVVVKSLLMAKNRKSHAGIDRCRNFRNLYLNETAPRWERRRPRSSPVDLSNSRHPHHILPPLNEPLHAGNVPVPGRACVGLVLLLLRVSSRLSKPPLLPARPIYSIKANRMPPRGFVQEPVPERPRRLAVESSSAPRPFGYRLLPFLYGAPVQHRRKLILYKLRLVPQSGWPHPVFSRHGPAFQLRKAADCAFRPGTDPCAAAAERRPERRRQ